MNKVKVLWNDAVIYDRYSDISQGLSKMETTGELVKQMGSYLIIKDPITKNLTRPDKSGWVIKCYRRLKFKKQRPRFFYIPLGMIQRYRNR